MHPTNTFSFTRQLEDGTTMEVSLAFRFTRTPDGHMHLAMADAMALVPAEIVVPCEPQRTDMRLPTESDEKYLHRLITQGLAKPRKLSDWAKCLSVSLRKLTLEKKAGRIAYELKGETRAGNAHLVAADEIMKAIQRLTSAA